MIENEYYRANSFHLNDIPMIENDQDKIWKNQKNVCDLLYESLLKFSKVLTSEFLKEFLHICRNMTDEQVDAVLQKFGKKKEGQVTWFLGNI